MMTLALALLLSADPRQFDNEIFEAIEATKQVYVVPPELIRAVMKQESGFNPKALSACGAVGLMQVMPFNAKKLGLPDEESLWNPRLNVLAGVRLLAVLLKHYEGDVIAALVAYNSGPKAKLAAVPQNGETPEYVMNILRYWRAFDRERASAQQAFTTTPGSRTR